MTNLVSNTGVIGTDVSGVGTARKFLASCEYGGDKGIVGYGDAPPSYSSLSNLVSNSGVVATDTSAVGTAKGELGACSFN